MTEETATDGQDESREDKSEASQLGSPNQDSPRLSSPKQLFPAVTHVIFDLDGLLVDTENYYESVYKLVMARHGAEYSWQLKEKTCGYRLEEAARIIISELDLPTSVPELCEQILDEFSLNVHTVQLMEGSKRLVHYLASAGIPMAIATGSSHLTYHKKVAPHGDFFTPGKYFQHVVLAGSDPDVKQNKPAPDAYVVAASRFPAPGPASPEHCLVFEDSPPGVESARAAGMQCVMVPDPRLDTSNGEIMRVQPTVIIGSLLDFRPEEFGLPPFPSSPS